MIYEKGNIYVIILISKIETMNKLLLSLLFLLNFLFFLSPVVFAQGDPLPGTGDPIKTQDTSTAQSVSLTNPLGEGVTVYTVISRVITAALGIVGSLALVMFIYGGFTWMLAAGNNEKIKKGKDILVWSAIGLVVIFSSYAVVKYLITTIGSS